MRWKVVAADAETGRDVILTLDAADKADAESFARSKGFVIAAAEGETVAVPVGYEDVAPLANRVTLMPGLLRGSRCLHFTGVACLGLGAASAAVAALLWIMSAAGATSPRDQSGTIVPLLLLAVGLLVVGMFLATVGAMAQAVREIATR